MLHLIRLIERRHPERADRIVGALLAGSVALLGLGIGLVVLR